MCDNERIWYIPKTFVLFDAFYAVNIFKHLLTWNYGYPKSFIDVGCEDGEIINAVILPKLTSNFKKIVGVDISNEMIETAKYFCGHPRITFSLMDISTKVNDDFINEFHHLTAFDTLHLLPENYQQITIENIYKMLKPRGDCIIRVIINNPIQATHSLLLDHPKWGNYIRREKNLSISPYNFVKKPMETFVEYLKTSGFKEFEVNLAISKFPMYMDNLKALIRNSSPIMEYIQPINREEYLNDFINLMVENSPPKPSRSKSAEFVLQYTWLMAFARK